MKKSSFLICTAFSVFFTLVEGVSIGSCNTRVEQVKKEYKPITIQQYIADEERELIRFSEDQLRDEVSRLTTISKLDDLLSKKIDYLIHEIDPCQPIFYNERKCGSENGKYLFQRAKSAQDKALTQDQAGLAAQICYQRGLEHFSKHIAHKLGTITDGNQNTKKYDVTDYCGTFIDVVKTINAYEELALCIGKIIDFNNASCLDDEAKKQIDLIAIYKMLCFFINSSSIVYYGSYDWNVNGETIHNELYYNDETQESEDYAGKTFETQCFSLLFKCPTLYGVREILEFQHLFIPCHHEVTINKADGSNLILPPKIAAIYAIADEGAAARKFRKDSIYELSSVQVCLSIDRRTTQDLTSTVSVASEGERGKDKEDGNTFERSDEDDKKVTKSKVSHYGKYNKLKKSGSSQQQTKKNTKRKAVINKSASQTNKVEMNLTFKGSQLKATIESVINDQIKYILDGAEMFDTYVPLIQKNDYMDSKFHEFIEKYNKLMEQEDRRTKTDFMINKLQGDVKLNLNYLKEFCIARQEMLQVGIQNYNGVMKELSDYLTLLEKWCNSERKEKFEVPFMSQCVRGIVQEYNIDRIITKIWHKEILINSLQEDLKRIGENDSSDLLKVETVVLESLKTVYEKTENEYVRSQIMAMALYLDKYYNSNQDNIASSVFSYILENNNGLLFLSLVEEISKKYNLTITDAIDIFYKSFAHFIIMKGSCKSSIFDIINKYGCEIKLLIVNDYQMGKKQCFEMRKEHEVKINKEINDVKIEASKVNVVISDTQIDEFRKLCLKHYDIFNSEDTIDREKIPLKIKDIMAYPMFYGSIKNLKSTMEIGKNVVARYKKMSLTTSDKLKKFISEIEAFIERQGIPENNIFFDDVFKLKHTIHEEMLKFDPMVYKLLELEANIKTIISILSVDSFSGSVEDSAYELKKEVEKFEQIDNSDDLIFGLQNNFYSVMPSVMEIVNLISNCDVLDISDYLYDIDIVRKCSDAKKVLNVILNGQILNLGSSSKKMINTFIGYLDKIIKLFVLHQMKCQSERHHKSIENLYKYRWCYLSNVIVNELEDSNYSKKCLCNASSDLLAVINIIIKMHDAAQIDSNRQRLLILNQLTADIAKVGYDDISYNRAQYTVVDSYKMPYPDRDAFINSLSTACSALWLISKGSKETSMKDRIELFYEFVNPINEAFERNLHNMNVHECIDDFNNIARNLYKIDYTVNYSEEIKTLMLELSAGKDIEATGYKIAQKVTNTINGLSQKHELKETFEMNRKIHFVRQLERLRDSASQLFEEFK